MNRKGAEGLPAGPPVLPAANEEFARTDEREQLAYTQAGWDPYEVWRTRVKASSSRKTEHERDPLR
jgi:hypothetical protein